MSKENRLGEAVRLLMDAATIINNQSDIAKRIDDFIGSIHPAECVDLPPEAGHITIPRHVAEQIMSTIDAGMDVVFSWDDEFRAAVEPHLREPQGDR